MHAQAHTRTHTHTRPQAQVHTQAHAREHTGTRAGTHAHHKTHKQSRVAAVSKTVNEGDTLNRTSSITLKVDKTGDLVSLLIACHDDS